MIIDGKAYYQSDISSNTFCGSGDNYLHNEGVGGDNGESKYR